jgi:hypothetical protein
MIPDERIAMFLRDLSEVSRKHNVYLDPVDMVVLRENYPKGNYKTGQLIEGTIGNPSAEDAVLSHLHWGEEAPREDE